MYPACFTYDSSPARAQTCARGFTLLEVMLVMMIIGVITALVFPKITNLGGGNLKVETRTLIGHIQALYSEATFTRKMHRLVFDLDAERYHAEVAVNGVYSPVEDNFLKPVKLPVNIEFTDVVTQGASKRSEGRAYAYFHPLGRVDFTTIHMEDEDDVAMTLEINPLTGRVQVKEGYVDVLSG